jgi:N-methylhydantoinase B
MRSISTSADCVQPYIYEYKDYAVGIVDANGDLICQCTAGMPVFVADVMRVAVLDGLKLYGRDNLFAGDIVVTNYAGTIGQHLNNVTMYTPIYAPDEPTLIGFMVVVMHWIDIGGRESGRCRVLDRHLQEGIQFRTVKLYRAVNRRPDVPHDRAHPVFRWRCSAISTRRSAVA